MDGPISFLGSRNRKRLILHEHDDDGDDDRKSVEKTELLLTMRGEVGNNEHFT
jgi:hypothetical protein